MSLKVSTRTFFTNLAGPIHVPDPRVVHDGLEVGLAALGVLDHLDIVGEVEATLGLDDVAEQAYHVAVLPVELKLHLGLVLLEILGAHDTHSSLIEVDRVVVDGGFGAAATSRCGR